MQYTVYQYHIGCWSMYFQYILYWMHWKTNKTFERKFGNLALAYWHKLNDKNYYNWNKKLYRNITTRTHARTHYICKQSWPKISAPLVNMIKEGCENESALLILLIFYWINIHKKDNLSFDNKNLKWGGGISLWNKCFSLIHIGHNLRPLFIQYFLKPPFISLTAQNVLL